MEQCDFLELTRAINVERYASRGDIRIEREHLPTQLCRTEPAKISLMQYVLILAHRMPDLDDIDRGLERCATEEERERKKENKRRGIIGRAWLDFWQHQCDYTRRHTRNIQELPCDAVSGSLEALEDAFAGQGFLRFKGELRSRQQTTEKGIKPTFHGRGLGQEYQPPAESAIPF